MKLRPTLHPQINEVLDLFEKEEHPFSKIHRMIDLFEIIIKTHTAFIIADYFRVKNVSDEVKELLAEGLFTPSLGMWQVFNRVIMEDLSKVEKLSLNQYKTIINSLNQEEGKQFASLYIEKSDFYQLLSPLTTKQRRNLRKYAAGLGYQFSTPLFLNHFYPYFFSWDKKISAEISLGNKKIPNPIQLRNKYAHGATPEPTQCEQDIQDYLPVLEQLLQADWFNETTIVVFEKEDNQIRRIPFRHELTPFPFKEQWNKAIKQYTYLRPNQPYLLNQQRELLPLFPIMTCKRINDDMNISLLFFNDLKKFKKNQVSFLNYPNAYHLNDSEIYEDFLSILNVMEWKAKVTKNFKERIEELTDIFQGRKKEQETIQSFIERKEKGFLFIFGNPGIGKSALLANFIKKYKYSFEKDQSNLVNEIYLVEYLIRRNSKYANPSKLLDSISSQLEKIYRTKLPFGHTLEEKRDFLDQRLNLISNQFQLVKKKLIICIDGLDEGIDNQLHEYLITQSYRQILIIYTSRPLSKIDLLYLKVPVEEKERIILEGLTHKDIRGLLYQVTNKYELIRNPAYVDLILKKSAGNPLYLKLLCAELEKHSLLMDHLDRLPARIEDFYEEILHRLRKDKIGAMLLDTLYIIAIAQDFLSAKQIELILPSGTVEVEEILEKLYEVLYESADEQGSYQLFHESFREYLIQTRNDQVRDAEWKVVYYCQKWDQLKNYSDAIQSYPLRHYSKHLVHLNQKEQLNHLVEDTKYLEAQIITTKQYLPSMEMYHDAMQLANSDVNQMISITVKLAQLHQLIGSQIPKLIASADQIENELNYSLKQTLLFKGVEQFLLYIHLLSHTLTHPLIHNEEKRKRLNQIIFHYDEHADVSIIGFKWCDFMSLSFMVNLLAQIKKLDVDVTPFLQRSDLQNLDNEVIEYELSMFDLNDNDYYRICSSLFLNNIYQPCLRSWSVLLGQSGIFERALETADKMTDLDLKVKTLSQIAVQMKVARKEKELLEVYEKAEKFAEQIDQNFLRVSAFCSLAHSYYFAGNNVKVEYWLKRAVAITSALSDFRNRSYAFREIAITISQVKDPQEAINLIDKNEMDNWNKGLALNQIVLDFYKSGCFDKMETQLIAVKDLLTNTVDYRDKRFIIRSLSITLGKIGKDQEALELLQEANEVWNALRVLRSISNHMGQQNLEDKVFNLCEDQTDLYLKVLVLGGIVTAKSVSNQFNDAQIIYEQLSRKLASTKVNKNSFSMTNIHSSIIREKESITNPQKSAQEIKKIETLTDEGTRPVLLAYLATRLSKGGFLTEAGNVMIKAKQLASQIENSHNQAHALSEIAREYSRQGLFGPALDCMQAIRYLWNITPVLRQLAHDLTKSENYDLLFSIIRKQKDTISVLVMMDETVQVLHPSGFEKLIVFLKKEIYSELIKTHTYDRVIRRMDSWKEKINIISLLLRIIPDVSYNKNLIGKCLIIYYEELKKVNKNSNHIKNIYESLEFLVDISSDDHRDGKFIYKNWNDWIGQIGHEDDLIMIHQLIKRVKTKKLTEEQFETMVANLLE